MTPRSVNPPVKKAAPRPRRRRLSSHERRVLLLALLTGLPGGAVALILLWTGDFSDRLQWTLTLLVVGGWLGLALALRERVVRPLQTLSNLLAALEEGDYSIRARGADTEDALGLALREVNALSATLRAQRLGAVEATALLRRVIEEIDVAIFTFDSEHRLRLTNRAGERLLAQPSERLIGRDADSLGLGSCLDGDTPRTLNTTFPGSVGRFELRRSTFRQGGLPHTLLVLADLSRTLREEERQVWKRLVRVLSHEINNSLAPIKSIAGSLQSLLARDPLPSDWQDDVARGLYVIGGRSEALSRFMASYAQLARLPAPRLAPVDIAAWVRRTAALETRLPVQIAGGPDMVIAADSDQLEQLLINLIRNAVDASLQTGGGVKVGWNRSDGAVEVWVRDEGPGLPDTGNLFVPFFTTKPNGTGIGLVLSRQIAEAHGGSLTLENRDSGPGCIARLRVPVTATRADGPFGPSQR